MVTGTGAYYTMEHNGTLGSRYQCEINSLHTQQLGNTLVTITDKPIVTKLQFSK